MDCFVATLLAMTSLRAEGVLPTSLRAKGVAIHFYQLNKELKASRAAAALSIPPAPVTPFVLARK